MSVKKTNYKADIPTPDIDGLNEVERIVRSMSELEKEIKELKKSLPIACEKLSSNIKTDDDRQHVADYLYWNVWDINITTVGEFILRNDVKNNTSSLVSNVMIDVPCGSCGALFSFVCTSRNDLKSTLVQLKRIESKKRHNHFRCVKCREFESDRFAMKAHNRALRARELKTMPYNEYLKTPEWQLRRKNHLRSAGYKCQLCNNGDTVLDVHHRTYENRGDEHYRDLIVLCRDCHSKFHNHNEVTE